MFETSLSLPEDFDDDWESTLPLFGMAFGADEAGAPPRRAMSGARCPRGGGAGFVDRCGRDAGVVDAEGSCFDAAGWGVVTAGGGGAGAGCAVAAGCGAKVGC